MNAAYRWFTVAAWADGTSERWDCGLKLGPVTLWSYVQYGRVWTYVSVLQSPVWDPLMYALRRGPFAEPR